jgi:hypothetical protein
MFWTPTGAAAPADPPRAPAVPLLAAPQPPAPPPPAVQHHMGVGVWGGGVWGLWAAPSRRGCGFFKGLGFGLHACMASQREACEAS